MKQLDYARLAEDCSKQADAMRPGPERDALIAKAKLYRSYAKMEDWIASPASAACELTNARPAKRPR